MSSRIVWYDNEAHYLAFALESVCYLACGIVVSLPPDSDVIHLNNLKPGLLGCKNN